MALTTKRTCDVCGENIPVAGYNFGQTGEFIKTPNTISCPESWDICYDCYHIYEKVKEVKKQGEKAKEQNND